ncbi:hypothetical protein RhiirA5_486904 [Rhizophagus irregularis]|uniref:Replication origin-binding protein domain-containing protein n=1 Tax=Rhizophagus irregularis TaxID=588596 RepID=A0A2N0PDH2_9GLOM|nr:hypothetical protein RhiirA5_486904 [Rhizophagus irregularis]PKC60824.1 hypothetical protein RhiirA1_467478 [Rhizophagus irregularis]
MAFFGLASVLYKCSWHIVYPYTHFIDYRDLRGFVEKVADRVGKPYSEFIDVGLYKSHFSHRLLGSAKEDRVKRPVLSSVKQGYCKLENYLVQPKSNYSEIWPRTFSSEKPEKDEFQPIKNETALSKGASQVTAKFGWLEIGSIKKGFINFQAKSYEACPICDICHERDQLYGFLLRDGCFILKCYWQKQYKPDHRGLVFKGASDIIKPKERPKQKIVDRMANAISNPYPLSELSGGVINVKEMEDFPEAYPDFLNEVPSTTLIRSPIITGKTKGLRKHLHSLARSKANLPCILWISYRKTLSNESLGKINDLKLAELRICNYQDEWNLSVDKWDIIIVQVESLSRIEFLARPIVAILDEANAIHRQMSSGVNARESESVMHDVLKTAQHILAMDAFANESTLNFLKAYREDDIW